MSKEKTKYCLVATLVCQLDGVNTKEEARAKAEKWRADLPKDQREEIEFIKVFEL